MYLIDRVVKRILTDTTKINIKSEKMIRLDEIISDMDSFYFLLSSYEMSSPTTSE